MANIRRKIEKNPAEPEYLFTEVGVGYRMGGGGCLSRRFVHIPKSKQQVPLSDGQGNFLYRWRFSAPYAILDLTNF